MTATAKKTLETPLDFQTPAQGWALAKMGDVADIVGGGTPRTSDESNFAEDNHAWVTPADLSGFKEMYIARGKRSLSDKGLKSCSARIMPKGTVLMSSRAPIGYIAIAANPISTNQGFKSFVCYPDILPEYVYFWLRFLSPSLESMGSGSTFLEISGSRAREIPILIAPTAEEKRIVAKVEELLVRVNAARERLVKVKEILKRFRQSVLAAAFLGRLTNNDVSVDRRSDKAAQFVSELWNVRRMGSLKISDKSSTEKVIKANIKHSEVEPADIVLLQETPSHWRWASLSTCTDVADGTHDSPKYYESGIPLVTSKNLTSTGIDFKNVKLISVKDHDQISKRSCVSDGDVLFAMIGTIGNPTIIHGGHPFSIKNVALFRTFENFQLAKYIKYWLSSPFVQNYFQETSKGSTQPFAPLNVLRRFPVPIPPRSEFEEIIDRTEGLFKLADAIEKRVAVATSRAEKLTQSILARAFRGELVPTEAELARQEGRSHEPASVLLERIRKAREEARTRAKATKKKEKGVREMEKVKPIKKRRPIHEVLVEARSSITPEQAFEKAGFTEDSVEEFFEELRGVVKKGIVQELRPNDTEVYLEAVAQ